MENKQDKGFTLVELLIVIVILGILATVTVLAVSGITDKAKTNACVCRRGHPPDGLRVGLRAAERRGADSCPAAGLAEQQQLDQGRRRTVGHASGATPATCQDADQAPDAVGCSAHHLDLIPQA